MIKRSLIFALLALSGTVFSQSLIHASHAGTEASYGLAGINNRTFHITKSANLWSCCAQSIALVGRDPNGAVTFSRFLLPIFQMDRAFLEVSADQHLLTAVGFWKKWCDLGPNRYQVSKVDTLGNVAWQFEVENQYVTGLLPQPDGSFYLLLIPGNKLRHYNSAGQSVKELTLSAGAISSLCNLNNGNILLSQVTGTGWVLKELDTSGTIVGNIPVNGGLANMVQAPDGSIYGLSAGSLQKYDAGGNLVATTASISPSSSVTAFQVRNDTTFAAVSNSLFAPGYLVLGATFNLLYQSSTNLENATPAGIYIDKQNKVNIVGTGPRDYYPSNTFTSYFQTQLTGNINGRYDVGVSDVQLENFSYWLTFNQIHATAEATLTVKNYGLDTVKSFHVNHYGTFSSLCKYFYGFNLPVNQSLAPGATVSIPTGTFYTHAHSLNGAPQAPDSLIYCFFTTVPNEENDVDVTNDKVCRKISTTAITELSDMITYRIFPNPALNSVTISCAKEIIELVVTDCLGRSCLKRLPRSTEVSLHLDQLSNGIYIVQVKTTYGTLQSKLVVDGK